jgi:hypothetical protein
MPFTPAHPAVVVPLARRWPGYFVLSALVVGSMAPDFEYFVYLSPVRTIGHDLVGIPLLCVPTGLAVLWLFEIVLKKPIALLLPRQIRERLLPSCEPLAFLPAGQSVAILLSLAVGASSHIAWDSLTHANGWVVERVPILSAYLWHGVPVFKLLQHGSTIGGLSLLLLWFWCWLVRQVPRPELDNPGLSRSWRLGIVVALMATACGAGILVCVPGFDAARWHGLVVRFIIAFITSLLGGALAYSIGYHVLGVSRRRTPA